jgi:hypothetical protein
MLQGVGELLLRCRALGFVHHGGGGTGRATTDRSNEARGAAPTATVVPMMAAAPSIGVTAVVAAVTALEGVAVAAVAGAAPAESAAAIDTRAARVFLLRLPSGQRHLWGTGGVTAGSFTLFFLPNGWPRLRPLGSPGPSTSAPPRAPDDDMARASWKEGGAAQQGRRRRKGVGENPRELRGFKRG